MKSRRFDSTVLAFPLNASEYRDAVERYKVEKEIHKQRTVAALTSPSYDPERRIRLWESLHGLNLPKSTDHRLLDLIAQKTALTVDQVRQEQARRQNLIDGKSQTEVTAPV
ncbi:MAG TPA: hypothetical protein VK629_09755 [Steroidobacteraceae bacterium]|nr:hypothetical protein [Steroidobacteraceae bacterium]